MCVALALFRFVMSNVQRALTGDVCSDEPQVNEPILNAGIIDFSSIWFSVFVLLFVLFLLCLAFASFLIVSIDVMKVAC